jgi:TonB family protein
MHNLPRVGRRPAAVVLFLTLLIAQVARSAPASAAEDLYGDPALRAWVRPAYEVGWRQEKLEGEVLVRFIVDVTGAVHTVRAFRASDSRLEAAATAAVAQWSFSPAIERGQPVACGMEVRTLFRLEHQGQPTPLYPPPAEEPKALPVVPASERHAPDPEYPPEWLERRIPAVVEVEFRVDEQGQVVEPVVTGASHGGFVPAALAALRTWKFRPAMQGDLPRPSRQGARLEFQASEVSIEDGLVREKLEAHGIRPTSPAPSWTVEPRLRQSVDPVHPYDLALAGVTGEAEVGFTVTPGGAVRAVSIVSASRPEFGAALAAAVQSWGFRAARSRQEAVAADLVVLWRFGDPRASNRSHAGLWRRVAGGEVIGSARGLDRPLRPVFRVPPVYPAELREEAVSGEAQLEFVIDRHGVAQLVRVRSATHEAFGYAAATAVSQWCFDPPTRDGEPVDIRVVIPFNFAPPP